MSDVKFESLIDADAARKMVGGVCKKTLYKLVRKDGLRAIPVGGQKMFDPADVRQWIEAQKAKAATN